MTTKIALCDMLSGQSLAVTLEEFSSILAWGSVYKTHIKKIQIKQNHTVRLIFFASTFGRETESAKPLLNLLDLLTVDNIYRLEVLKFSHSWHNGLLPNVFDNTFQYARDSQKYNLHQIYS